MKSHRLFAVCLMGLLVCGQVGATQQPSVSGQVRLPSGLPVSGAQVVLFDVTDLRRGIVAHTTTDEVGHFALPLTVLGSATLPQATLLGQNYPNPFNPSTVIPYKLAASSWVRLEVFNLLGQRIATLVDNEQAAGAYRAQWDGTDIAGQAVAAGVYLYRLTVDGEQQTKRLVLIDGQAGIPLHGGRVDDLSTVETTNAAYGLVVSGREIVPYVDAAVAADVGPMAIEVQVRQEVRMKVVQNSSRLLGDVNADNRVNMLDALLLAMYIADPSIVMPNNGDISLGDVNADGRLDFVDAYMIGLYSVWNLDPSLPPGIGYSEDGTGAESAPSDAGGSSPGGVLFRDCGLCPAMMVVPAGSFTMGSPDSEDGRQANEGPQHVVTIAQPLAVGMREVTFAEWDACVKEGGCDYQPSSSDRGNYPVVNISWEDAQVYLTWLSAHTGHSYRLLSESEWEYVARAGTATPYFFGNTISTDDANYNYAIGSTTTVGAYSANAFGLYDLHGNVWEWVQDCSHSSYRGAPDDGTAWETPGCSKRVLRGGSWNDGWSGLRSAYRFDRSPNSRDGARGFRVARVLTGESITLPGQTYSTATDIGDLVNVQGIHIASSATSRSQINRFTLSERRLVRLGLDDLSENMDLYLEGELSGTIASSKNRATADESIVHILDPGTYYARIVAVGGKVSSSYAFSYESNPTEVITEDTGTVFQDCETCPYMIVVPAGSFTMGSPDGEDGREANEGPQHVVTIAQPLAVGMREVTFAEWDECVKEGGCDYQPSSSNRGNYPVVNISWEDAQVYLTWLSAHTGHSYRLLSESEWEYVARAGTATPYFFGNTISTDDANYNYAIGSTTTVGAYSANAFGLYDLHGNVWEWVQDCSHSSYRGAPDDGTAWETPGCSKRVLRGGSWNDGWSGLRSAYRFDQSPNSRDGARGFRVAREYSP